MSDLTDIDRMDGKSTGMAEECRSSFNRQLVDYLKGLEKDLGRKPGWPDVELMDLYKIAHSMLVQDIIDGGRDFYIRYWGTEMTTALGFDASGRLLGDLEPPEMTKYIFVRYRELVATGRNWFVSGALEYVPNKEYKTFEVVHLPLWDNAGTISHIVLPSMAMRLGASSRNVQAQAIKQAENNSGSIRFIRILSQRPPGTP